MPNLPAPPRSRLAVTAWCVTIAVLVAHLLPRAVQTGMFMDGSMYATISRNMAVGFGDLWHPAFSPGPGAHYYENPPLAFLLQSYAYRALGDHFWIEKFYSAATGLVALAFVAAIWRRLVEPRSLLAGYAWLPIALWLIWPGWTWQYENNWLENTMTVFTSFAVYCALRAGESSRHGWRWIALSGLSIFAAVLSKGPVGLFPLATPLIAWAALRRQTFGRAAAATAACLFFFSLALGLVLLQPAARDFLSRYLHQQVLASLAGQREHSVVWGQFFIIKSLKNNLRLPAQVAAAIVVIDYLRRRFTRRQLPQALPSAGEVRPIRAFLFCLTTAASASLPIMLSPKQWGHYAFPCYPFFALALACWCVPSLIRLVNSSKARIPAWLHHAVRSGAAIACVALVGVSCVQAGRPDQDPTTLHDTLVVQRLLPSTAVVGVSAEMLKDWNFFAYLSRWNNIGVDHDDDNRHEYFLTRTSQSDHAPAGYVAVPTEMLDYRLYRRSDVDRISAADGDNPERLGKTPDHAVH